MFVLSNVLIKRSRKHCVSQYNIIQSLTTDINETGGAGYLVICANRYICPDLDLIMSLSMIQSVFKLAHENYITFFVLE